MDISFIPKKIVQKISASSTRQIHWNVLISTTVVLGCLKLFLSFAMTSVPHVCIILKLTSWPCPGCGILTSIVALFELRIEDSLSANPVGIFIIGSLFLQIIIRAFSLITDKFSNQVFVLSKLISNFVLAILILYWIIRIIGI